jgi:hypothetical protein
MTAQIGTTDWHLTGIRTSAAGETCGHCPRTLKNLYDVTNSRTGQAMTVGRGCCKKVTGWTLSASEAARILRAAQQRAKRDAAWADFQQTNPELAAPIDAGTARGENTAYNFRFEISVSPFADVRERWGRQYLALAAA